MLPQFKPSFLSPYEGKMTKFSIIYVVLIRISFGFNIHRIFLLFFPSLVKLSEHTRLPPPEVELGGSKDCNISNIIMY